MPNEIVFYVTERGEFPVIEFLISLDPRARAKCYSYMNLLLELGNDLPSSHIKPLGNGLWELRPEFGGTEYRFFYFTIKNDTIIMLHSVVKKTQKTNPKDISLARKRMEETKP